MLSGYSIMPTSFPKYLRLKELPHLWYCGFDREIFSGRPTLRILWNMRCHFEEDKFLNHTLEDICSYTITDMKTQNILNDNMDRLKKSGIFALIPKGRKQILVLKLSATRCSGSLGVVAMVHLWDLENF